MISAEADSEIRMDDFDLAEIDKAIKSFNNYKAPGFDNNITAEESYMMGMN